MRSSQSLPPPTLDHLFAPERQAARDAAHDFSNRLFRAGRGLAELKAALEAALALERLCERQAAIEEELLFPELKERLGGAGGPIERARAEQRRVVRSFRLFHEAARRFEAHFPSRADARLMGQRGHELLRVLADQLGAVDGYLMRVADAALDDRARRALVERLEAALAQPS
ncbi:MAG: hemerythrin domain-containing protein [Deltaproteobacteria bacterium]